MLSNFLKWSTYIMSTPIFCWGSSLLSNFEKRGPYRISIFRRRLLEKRGWLYSAGGRGCKFYIKNKLKSEILKNKKKIPNQKCLSAIIKNLNWQILIKNLFTIKNRIGLKMENINIIGVHQFLGEGVIKSNI